MTTDGVDRRTFIRNMSESAAALSLVPPSGSGDVMSGADTVPQQTPVVSTRPPRIRFSVIGLNHGHITSMTTAVQRGGGELVAVYAKEPELVAAYTKQFPAARVARSEAEILEDTTIHAVLSASIPDERGPLGIRVMQHGKDFIVDKPGLSTLAHLDEARRVQAATKRIFSIVYSERFENRATVRAGDLVKAGAIGKVVQTIGLGPHRMNIPSRPAWFFEKARFGGILCDIASHQADQFLFFTGSTKAEVVASQVGNVHYRQYPNFEDFGDMLVRGNGGAGYIRVDWFTPDGLPTWGDGRLDHSWHERLHRDQKERRHRGPPRRQSPVPVGPEGDPLHRYHHSHVAVRHPDRRRHRAPHRHSHVASPLLLGHRAGAQGPGPGHTACARRVGAWG